MKFNRIAQYESELTIIVHPLLCRDFVEKCEDLKVKEPGDLIAGMMRDFLFECSFTNNKPRILKDSNLVEKNKPLVRNKNE